MESRKTYGTRRIKKKLTAEEIVASRKRIRHILAEQGLGAEARCKNRAATDSNHKHPVNPKVLGGRFDADYPNQVWVTDITYLKTRDAWLYWEVVMDLYSRMVVGWSINNRMAKDLVINALEKAIKRRNPDPGLICHSDRGSQCRN